MRATGRCLPKQLGFNLIGVPHSADPNFANFTRGHDATLLWHDPLRPAVARPHRLSLRQGCSQPDLGASPAREAQPGSPASWPSGRISRSRTSPSSAAMLVLAAIESKPTRAGELIVHLREDRLIAIRKRACAEHLPRRRGDRPTAVALHNPEPLVDSRMLSPAGH